MQGFMPLPINLFSGIHKTTGAPEWIIAGLGNPGAKYAETRHNAGFIALDALAERSGTRVTRVRFHALTGEARVAGVRVLLMKPQTYMNESGRALKEAMAFYKIPAERVLVMHDDISLEPGVLRIRRKGSSGGQKGLKSIIELCGSEGFPRIKLGVGAKPHPDYELADWVLSTFSREDRKKLDEAVAAALPAAELIVTGKIDEAMNRYSR